MYVHTIYLLLLPPLIVSWWKQRLRSPLAFLFMEPTGVGTLFVTSLFQIKIWSSFEKSAIRLFRSGCERDTANAYYRWVLIYVNVNLLMGLPPRQYVHGCTGILTNSSTVKHGYRALWATPCVRHRTEYCRSVWETCSWVGDYTITQPSYMVNANHHQRNNCETAPSNDWVCTPVTIHHLNWVLVCQLVESSQQRSPSQ